MHDDQAFSGKKNWLGTAHFSNKRRIFYPNRKVSLGLLNIGLETGLKCYTHG